jgi:predicted transposase/invertase (TIGR01784 family)
MSSTPLPPPPAPSRMQYAASQAPSPPEPPMPRPVFADPKTDFTFKRIFGSEEHEDVLIAFLNAMLDLDPPHRITAVELLPPEQRPVVDALKLSIVDVKCTDARGITYVVEMQVLQVEGFEKRVVYNVAKAYVNQISRGDLYPSLDDVVGITICDFPLWPDEGERKVPMLSRWAMTEQRSGTKALGQLQFVFLELPKYDGSRPPQTMVEKWAYFFREAGDLTMVPEVLAEPPFIEALEAARTAGFTATEWDAYILAGIAIQNERGALAVARKQGREEGREEGREQGLRDGIRRGVEALCRALRIELTQDRRRELAELEMAGLCALLARLEERGRWD